MKLATLDSYYVTLAGTITYVHLLVILATLANLPYTNRPSLHPVPLRVFSYPSLTTRSVSKIALNVNIDSHFVHSKPESYDHAYHILWRRSAHVGYRMGYPVQQT